MQSKKAVSTIYGKKVSWVVYVGGMGAVLSWAFFGVKRPSQSHQGYQGGMNLKGRQIDEATRALGGAHFGIESIIQAEIDANIEKGVGPVTAAERAALTYTADSGCDSLWHKFENPESPSCLKCG